MPDAFELVPEPVMVWPFRLRSMLLALIVMQSLEAVRISNKLVVTRSINNCATTNLYRLRSVCCDGKD